MKRPLYIIVSLLLAGSTANAALTPSELSEERLKTREKAFTDWFSENTDTEFDRRSLRGRYPIYIEQSKEGFRGLFIELPDGAAFYYWYGVNEESLISNNRDLVKKKMTLLTLSCYRQGGEKKTRYCGVWVKTTHLKDALQRIKHYGISQASLDDVSSKGNKNKPGKKK